jgi:hypothetical protein
MLNIIGFWSLLRQSKFDSLTLLRDTNQEGVPTVLVIAAR